MIVHDQAELDSVSGIVTRRFSTGHMSDTKWRKLFGALSDDGFSSLRATFKRVDQDNTHIVSMPRRESLYPPYPWIDAFWSAPFPLRAIEWIHIPRQARIRMGRANLTKTIEQDVEHVFQLIEGLGRFPIELNEDGLMIRAYS